MADVEIISMLMPCSASTSNMVAATPGLDFMPAPMRLTRPISLSWLTALASMTDVTPTLPMAMFTLFQKRLLGSLYGEANPRADIHRLLSLYREGKLLLDETVTAEYKLNDINEGYDDMLAGRNIRGVIIHDQ